MMSRVCRVVGVVAVVCVVVAAGCGDSDDGGGGADSGGSSSADVVSAVLGIITTNIDTDTGEGFADAVEGEELTVGDRVRTDDTGFAEVTYHDGSWMRVESEATLTIVDLVDGDVGQVVSTSIDTGEAWSRVRELSEPEDGFVVDTPVASAAVRGTAFAIDCEGDTVCTFSVLEGEVLVTPEVGDAVTLTAGQSLTVTAGEEPPAPAEPGVIGLARDEFIAKNLELDREQDPSLGPTEEEASGPDLGEAFAATPVLVGAGTPEVLGCAGADVALVSRLADREERLGESWSVLDGEDLYAALVVALGCGGTESVIAVWVPSLGTGLDGCVADRFRQESPERFAAVVSGVDPSGVLAPGSPQSVVADVAVACTPVTTTTTAAPPAPRSSTGGSSNESGGGITAIG
jgi:hypothetical protein